MKRSRWVQILAGGGAALVSGALVAARLVRAKRTDPHELYARQFRLAHEALRRNLDHFVALIDGDHELDLAAFGEIVRLYADFLVVHHDSEDEVLFPLLRKSGRLRTTDAAHLERWSAEHRDVNRVGRLLGRAGAALEPAGRAKIPLVRRLSLELVELLRPHLAYEEELINAERLREMVSARAIARAGRRAARFADSPARMAAFYAHSLHAEEQRQVFGEAPWFFRKVILPRVDRRLYRRASSVALAPAVEV
jgi:hemerythrin-like domain-containing protein